MRIKMRIRRFNPEADSKPWWGEYWVDVEESDRVLDALHQVKWYQDGTLTLRRSCAHGICGSDAMVINGRNALACKVLMQDVGDECQVEPLRSMPLIKDLVVDMEPFFAKYRAVLPYLINDNLPAEGERYQSQEARARYDDTTKCILCAACTTSCPSFWANEDYIGPAAIVQAHRFIFDDRDAAADLRLRVLNDVDGVWRCRTVFNCVQACPREIDVTRAIGEVKLALMNGLED
ncbi:MAG: succinate dehydrogenase iron-sulfur subunit [Caldilineaceae bacterium]|nr:succinate dehydrogenase iron-sulfur subunit [Caldilineaceae bacterium]MCY3993508.1 succinate dehydrogenase iron-sulfur subunit [Caldilineaceae bacterium]MDE0077335.1 succinate dehydrogenase iron-sulfur subunit [Caldilineaceae bacterium]